MFHVFAGLLACLLVVSFILVLMMPVPVCLLMYFSLVLMFVCLLACLLFALVWFRCFCLFACLLACLFD